MKQSSYAWSRAYARQAQADLEARVALLGAMVPACQHLHFLQIACEKIAKAHRCLGGADPAITAAARMAGCPKRQEAGRNREAGRAYQGCMLGSSTANPSAVAAALRSWSAETKVTGPRPPV
jgi:hypothetical protein